MGRVKKAVALALCVPVGLYPASAFAQSICCGISPIPPQYVTCPPSTCTNGVLYVCNDGSGDSYVGSGGACVESSGSGGTGVTCGTATLYSRAEIIDPNSAATFADPNGPSCFAWSNISAGPTIYGRAVPVDMEVFTHLKLMVWGSNPSGAGSVTMSLVDITTESTAPTVIVSGTIPSATATCADYSSNTSNQTGLTGVHVFAFRATATALDDPRIADIVLQYCTGALP